MSDILDTREDWQKGLDPTYVDPPPDVPWIKVVQDELIRKNGRHYTFYEDHIKDYPLTRSDLDRSSKHQHINYFVRFPIDFLDHHNVLVVCNNQTMAIYQHAHPHHTKGQYAYFEWVGR